MAELDTWVEIAVYVGGAIGIIALLAHVFNRPMETPPLSFASTTPCGCGKG